MSGQPHHPWTSSALLCSNSSIWTLNVLSRVFSFLVCEASWCWKRQQVLSKPFQDKIEKWIFQCLFFFRRLTLLSDQLACGTRSGRFGREQPACRTPPPSQHASPAPSHSPWLCWSWWKTQTQKKPLKQSIGGLRMSGVHIKDFIPRLNLNRR